MSYFFTNFLVPASLSLLTCWVAGLGSCLSKSPRVGLSSRGVCRSWTAPPMLQRPWQGLSARKICSRGEKLSELTPSWRRARGTGAEVQLPVLGHPPCSLHSILPRWRSVFRPGLLKAAVARPGFYSVIKFYSVRDAQSMRREATISHLTNQAGSS
jgi:hypothetical protein